MCVCGCENPTEDDVFRKFVLRGDGKRRVAGQGAQQNVNNRLYSVISTGVPFPPWLRESLRGGAIASSTEPQ